ncbi:MAG: hypothetical protein ACLFRG_14675 [Desulfococcaceae bacterium]
MSFPTIPEFGFFATRKFVDTAKSRFTFPPTTKRENPTQSQGGMTMGEKDKTGKVENYIESDEEREEGHLDTRKNIQECEKPDPNLGCDPGVDVPG